MVAIRRSQKRCFRV